MAWELIGSSSVVSCLERIFEAIYVWIERPNVCSRVVSCAIVEDLDGMPDNAAMLAFMRFMCGNPVDSPSENNASHDAAVRENESTFKRCLRRKFVPKKPTLHSECAELITLDDTSVVFVPLHHGFDPDFEEIVYKINITDNQTNSEGEKYFVIELLTYEHSKPSGDPCKGTCSPTKLWLAEKLFPAIIKWVKTADESKNSSFKKVLPPSLSLIPRNEYAELYETLKEKYGKKLMKIWQEVTDPQKYIYEDIAIATYLILLWKKERQLKNLDKLQTFIDLGCGNGLLVFILNSEGHRGTGVDLRPRKIWDLFPSNADLREGIIDPTSDVLYSEYDWLLGNHSDELTPWLPVLAARSGFNIRYWVLSCCFFDFFSKYKRSDSTLSQYDDYLGFVENIGKICGFDVEIDVMRIPSTKRVCHVGMQKLHSLNEHSNVLKNVNNFIEQRRLFRERFKAREKLEKVKNCTKMEKSIQENIVQIIVNKLLETNNSVTIECSSTGKSCALKSQFDELVISNGKMESSERNHSGSKLNVNSQASHVDVRGCVPRSGPLNKNGQKFQSDDDAALKTAHDNKKASDGLHDSSNSRTPSFNSEKPNNDAFQMLENSSRKDVRYWNRGGVLSLEEAAALLGDELKSKMKSECGGLQTLLRNHHQIFEIRDAKVKLRDWSSPDCLKKKKKNSASAVKTRQCWFYFNHPDGCPQSDNNCSFLHKETAS